MSTARSRGRALARLLTACALLFGLFLMHGSPASAATGCHEGAQGHVAAAPAEHPAHGEHSMAAETAPNTSHTSAHIDARAVTGEHGTVCVATAARDRFPLPTVWLLAAAAFAGLTAWGLVRQRMTAGGARRRGPPGGGRALLLRKCVARN